MELRGSNALVLGASGFLGSNLVIALTRAGARVVAATRSQAPGDEELESALARSEVVRFDLGDPASIARIVPVEGAVFLAAGLSGAVDSLARAREDLEANGRGVLNVLEALRAKKSRARVVFPSSQLVYGRPGTLKEEDPVEPLSLYAVHKLLGEHHGRVYERLHGVPFVALRIANPYGPRQRSSGGAYGLVRFFLDRALSGGDVPVYGDGTQERGYVHVDDVVQSMLLAAEKGRGTYNVGAAACSVKEMAEAVVRAAGRGRVVSVPWPEEALKVEPGSARLDTSRAERELGWRATVKLDEGLRRTVEFLRGKR